jgi:hypothetical protein
VRFGVPERELGGVDVECLVESEKDVILNMSKITGHDRV